MKINNLEFCDVFFFFVFRLALVASFVFCTVLLGLLGMNA